MADYISDELFHFVGHRAPNDHEGNFGTLIKILRSNCISSEPPKVGWGTNTVRLKRGARLDSEELVVSNITCYCDIPLDALGLHIEKYGCFGLSLKKDYLIKYGARPVLYVPMSSNDWSSPYGHNLLRDIEGVVEGFMAQLYDERVEQLTTHSRSLTRVPATPREAIGALHSVLLKDFLAYIKPYNSDLPTTHSDYFYAEREWRRIGSMMFEPSDVQTIVVLAGFESRLREAMPNFSGKVHVIPPAIEDIHG